MRKRTLSTTPPQVQPRSDTGIVRQVRRYKVITPLFGGGANPQQPDEVTVVRASEIRGLLRFWWRATRGGQFGNIATMRKAEEAIWGSAAAKGKPGPSLISIVVNSAAKGTERKSVKVQKWNKRTRRMELVDVHIADPSSPYSYVAFPLREEKDGRKVTKHAGSVWTGVEFVIELSYDISQEIVIEGQKLDLVHECAAALWAWETFGGIGARTRRGFGALQLIERDGEQATLPNCNAIERQIRSNLETYVSSDNWPDGIPHLDTDVQLVVTKRFGSSDEAWMHLFNRLKKFRQARYPNRRQLPYGRSKWPEPDEIRRLTHIYDPKHAPRHPVRKFPRARFGLPILFQFKDQGDPPTMTLKPRDSERFASRLILRPIECANGSVGLALVLKGPEDPPGSYVLENSRSFDVQVNLSQEEADKTEPLNGNPDVLQAFLDTL